MRRGLLIVFMLVSVCGLAAAPSRSDPAAEILKLQDQLRAAETAFAQTMADRDHDAFASFIAEEAIFYGRNGEIRGKAAVVEAWKQFYEHKDAPFSWRPEMVAVLDSGTLGQTSGPVFDPKGKQTGSFQSVWRRTSDGRWEIIFDKGCPYCPEK